MRLHRNLVLAVINTLHHIFEKGVFADKAVEYSLKSNKKWGSRDRGFIAETVYEIVRWKRLYAEIAGVSQPYNSGDLWRIFAVWLTLKGIRIPHWDELSNTPVRRIKGKFDELSGIRAFRESIPDWLDEIGLKAFGEEKWSMELRALNQPAQVVLRANSLKNNTDELKELLDKEGIVTQKVKGYPEALILDKRMNVFTSNAFKEGRFEVQDASSQKVAHFVQAAPGQRLVDACAGAGGKTLHLAALMENKGQIIAMDIYKNKLAELKRRARRNGAYNIEPRLIESSKSIKKLSGSADRLLIDAPCTGLGVLRRNPDAKWKLSPDFLDRVRQIQQQILRDYSRMVKPGGKMVYATCSILPSENEEQTREFLKTEQGQYFELETEERLWPSGGFDGFYMARLIKSN